LTVWCLPVRLPSQRLIHFPKVKLHVYSAWSVVCHATRVFANSSNCNSDFRTELQSLQDNRHIIISSENVDQINTESIVDGQINSRYGRKAGSDKERLKVNLIQTLLYNKDRKKRKRTNCFSILPPATATIDIAGQGRSRRKVALVITWASQPCPVHAQSGRGRMVRRRWTRSNLCRWCP
jgi:uncharacterized membrane protein